MGKALGAMVKVDTELYRLDDAWERVLDVGQVPENLLSVLFCHRLFEL